MIKIVEDIARNVNSLLTDCSNCHKKLEGNDPVFYDLNWQPLHEIPHIHFCSEKCSKDMWSTNKERKTAEPAWLRFFMSAAIGWPQALEDNNILLYSTYSSYRGATHWNPTRPDPTRPEQLGIKKTPRIWGVEFRSNYFITSFSFRPWPQSIQFAIQCPICRHDQSL